MSLLLVSESAKLRLEPFGQRVRSVWPLRRCSESLQKPWLGMLLCQAEIVVEARYVSELSCQLQGKEVRDASWSKML
jgi:hypothetical protein